MKSTVGGKTNSRIAINKYTGGINWFAKHIILYIWYNTRVCFGIVWSNGNKSTSSPNKLVTQTSKPDCVNESGTQVVFEGSNRITVCM